MNRKKIHFAVVLDKSGSMSPRKEQALTFFNEHVQQFRQEAKLDEQDIYVSLVTFNGSVFEVTWNTDANLIEDAKPKDYQPDGSTALFDAMGYTISKLQKTVTDDEDTTYFLIIITDGQENSSVEYKNYEKLNSLIEELKSTKRWTFTFLGCDEQYLSVISRQTGIPLSNMAVMNLDSSQNCQQLYAASNNVLRDYMTSNKRGIVKSCALYSADEKKAMNLVVDQPTDSSNKTVCSQSISKK